MFIGGLDVGTTGCKLAVYNQSGKLFNTYYREYHVKHENGRHEIDFRDIKEGVMSILELAVKEYKLCVLGVTSFGETFAMLDENDNVLGPSMLYTDPRGEEECAELCEKVGEDTLTRITGAKPNPMYSISKLMWHKKYNSAIFSKAKRILLGEDFIAYTLTGNAKMDYSLAARTAAFDIRKKCWCKEIFRAAGIDSSLLSNPVPSGTVAGKLTGSLRSRFGIDYDLTVVCAGHDQVCAMIGSGVTDCGKAMDGTGTVECIPIVLENVPEDLDIYECGYAVVPFIDGKYACYALSFTGGATLKWFRDNFAEHEKADAEKNGENVYALLDKSVSDKPTGILVLPHFAGAATPYMDSLSKAAFVGVTLETTKADLYKALMEGTSYEILLNFNVLKKYAGDVTEIRATGGGASSDVWLGIKADILGTDIISLSCHEVGAAGAAVLAGKAVGAFADIKSAAAAMAPIKQVVSPDPENKKAYDVLYRKYKDLYNACKNLGKDA